MSASYLKESGAACPRCLSLPCAEYAQLHQEPRWTCNSCGASGPLAGQFAHATPAAPPPPPPPRGRRKAAAAGLLVLLAACAPAPDQVAVDACLLREYLEECESELATPEEAALCRRRAPLEATRPVGGIPAACREQRS